MDLTVVMKLSEENRKPEVGAYVQKHLAHKLGKIQTRWGKPLTARLVALETPEGFEVTVALQGDHDLVAKAHETKLPKAVDVAVDKLTRQFEQTTQLREGRERNRRQTPGKIPMEF